jgi:hypothetical protein
MSSRSTTVRLAVFLLLLLRDEGSVMGGSFAAARQDGMAPNSFLLLLRINPAANRGNLTSSSENNARDEKLDSSSALYI